MSHADHRTAVLTPLICLLLLFQVTPGLKPFTSDSVLGKQTPDVKTL